MDFNFNDLTTTSAPTTAPTNVGVTLVTAKVQQTLVGVSASTFLGNVAMQTTFKQTIAAAANVPTSAITINGVSRRLRRSLLDATITYTVTTTSAVTSSGALVAAVTNSNSQTALSNSLVRRACRSFSLPYVVRSFLLYLRLICIYLDLPSYLYCFPCYFLFCFCIVTVVVLCHVIKSLHSPLISQTFYGVTGASASVSASSATTDTPSNSPVAPPLLAPSSASASGAAAAATVSSCFAGSELLTLENGATKAMADVAVGDRVLTVNAKGQQVFSDVVYLPHGKNDERAIFVTIATEAGRDLKLTTNHFLPAGKCDAAAALPVITADRVSVGDCVQTMSGREKVVSVDTVEGHGIYTAIATEELLVVNGIVATPFGGINPTLVNIYYNLHRLVYSLGMAKGALAGRWLQEATLGLWGSLAALTN